MASIESYLQETPEKMLTIIEEADQLFAKVKQAAIERIVITGSGTSYHSGKQMAKQMQHLLQFEVVALYPFEMTKETFLKDSDKTLVVGISQGGSSYSTYNAMELAKNCGCMTASMAGSENTYIDEVADYVLTVYCGGETAGAKTKGFYCTKLNLLLLALNIGKAQGQISDPSYEKKLQQQKKLRTISKPFMMLHRSGLTCIKKF